MITGLMGLKNIYVVDVLMVEFIGIIEGSSWLGNNFFKTLLLYMIAYKRFRIARALLYSIKRNKAD